ncbi:hypothetical protein BJF82_05725 [Kytococcus sp. CUA-901]|nr:hypothetical protein BJF82_05725 [Kytococcus sp. CUA-901]
MAGRWARRRPGRRYGDGDSLDFDREVTPIDGVTGASGDVAGLHPEFVEVAVCHRPPTSQTPARMMH